MPLTVKVGKIMYTYIYFFNGSVYCDAQKRYLYGLNLGRIRKASNIHSPVYFYLIFFLTLNTYIPLGNKYTIYVKYKMYD